MNDFKDLMISITDKYDTKKNTLKSTIETEQIVDVTTENVYREKNYFCISLSELVSVKDNSEEICSILLPKVYEKYLMLEQSIKNYLYNRNATKIEDVISRFSSNTFCNDIVSEVINLLIEKKEIKSVYGYVYLNKMSFLSYFPTLLDSDEEKILRLRFGIDDNINRSLEDVGEKLRITRERVRQIEAKALRKLKHPNCLKLIRNCEEFAFYSLFEKYNLSNEEYDEIYNLPRYYRTLPFYIFGTCSQIRDERIENIASDDDFTPELKERYINVLSKGLIFKNNKYVKFDKKEVAIEIAKNSFGYQPFTADGFRTAYNYFIDSNGLDDKLKFSSERIVVNFLDSRDYLIKSHGKTYRYFEYKKLNPYNLVKKLGFRKIKDKFLSTKYFYDRYPDLMGEYGFQNPDELHNYLHKTEEEWNYKLNYHVTIQRMPHLEFGYADLEDQIEEFLIKKMPINKFEFYGLCEQEYGILAKTVYANNKQLNRYLVGDIYCDNQYDYYKKYNKWPDVQYEDDYDEDF